MLNKISKHLLNTGERLDASCLAASAALSPFSLVAKGARQFGLNGGTAGAIIQRTAEISDMVR
jgi:hypothetical protein